VLITLLSLFSFPGIDTDRGIRIPHMDKITHFIFYGVFVVLGTLALKEKISTPFKTNKIILRIFFAAIIYGVVIEVLQYLMPYDRAAEILDALANTIGAIFGGLLIKKYLSLTKKLK
jgi:VanZ family protein